MTIYYILFGIVLCSIMITTMQVWLANRKDMKEMMGLFEKVKIDD